MKLPTDIKVVKWKTFSVDSQIDNQLPKIQKVNYLKLKIVKSVKTQESWLLPSSIV